MSPDLVPVEGHPGYYVSRDGHVFSEKQGSLRRLKAQRDGQGYLHVVLSTLGRPQTTKVQYLVAAHFIGPRPKGFVLCHCDGNKENNAASNLRYDTQRNNIADIKLHGTESPPRGSVNGMSKLTEPQVIEIRRLRQLHGYTHEVLGTRFGVSRKQVGDIIARRYWKHV